MKRLFLAGALLLAALTTKTFAGDVPVTHVVLNSFKTEFAKATNVQWSAVDHLYRAEFTVAGEKTMAFFNVDDGALVATAHYITLAELPRALRSCLNAHMAEGKLIELFNVQTDMNIDYFAMVKQNDKTIVLKAAAAKWNVYKK